MNASIARWRPLLAVLVTFLVGAIVVAVAKVALDDRAAALKAASDNEQISAKALARVLSVSFEALSAQVEAASAVIERNQRTRDAFELARKQLTHPAFKSSLLVDSKGRVFMDGGKGTDADVSREAVVGHCVLTRSIWGTRR